MASLRYLCPISLRYSSMALVARVFSLKIRCSRSMNLSTSHIAMSDRKSCREEERRYCSVERTFEPADRWSVPWPFPCSAVCAPKHTPPPLCSWRSARAPARRTGCGSCWWRTPRTPCKAPWAGCSWSGSGTSGEAMRWWSSLLRRRLPLWGRWAGWPGTTAPQTAVRWCWRWGCWPALNMCSFPLIKTQLW